jgi:hypothetical protein
MKMKYLLILTLLAFTGPYVLAESKEQSESVQIVDADVEYIQRGEDYDGTQDISLSDPNLSLKYVRGAFLLYDCYEKHWVCTTKFEFRNCRETRDELLKDNTLELNCTPIKEFKSEAECVEEQRRITSRAIELRTCLHPNFQIQSKD